MKASSDFDVEHLKQPININWCSWKSNASAISKNLGLPEYILSNAGKYLNQEHVDIESLLKKVYDDKLEIEKEKEIIKKNSNQIELLRKSLERDNSKLNAEAESIVANAKIKAREILLNAKDEANEIIKELNDDKIDLKKANKLRLNLNDSLNSIASSPSTNKTFSFSKENISIGQTVFIKKLNQNATVLTLPNKSNQLQVQFGVITMNVKLEDLALPTNTANAQKTTHSSTSFKNSFKAKNISPEINVIGMTVDEAIPIIDQIFRRCFYERIS